MKEVTQLLRGTIVFVEIDALYPAGNETRNSWPCIVWRHMLSPPCAMIIPLTTNSESKRYPYASEIKKSPGNALEQDSIALVHQLRMIDNCRLRKLLGHISAKEIHQINDFLVQYLQLVFDDKKPGTK
jgi:mRNA-degrading endonuclease toxin of MazEF toxin-antitoxin module